MALTNPPGNVNDLLAAARETARRITAARDAARQVSAEILAAKPAKTGEGVKP